jgi:hypothetical protein
VYLRTGLDDMEKLKFLNLSGLELQPFGRPAYSQSLYRLHYPRYKAISIFCKIFTDYPKNYTIILPRLSTDIRDTSPRDHLLSIRSYYSTLHIGICYLIYIFMLVLAIDDTLTPSILLITKNFLTQIQRIR